MNFYLAPMEGITGYIVRNAYAHHFKGIDTFFTPFIPSGHAWNAKIKRDLSPDNNLGLKLIPQAISNDVNDLLDLESQLMDLGYQEYNLNLGCPSGTVTAKYRGSGLLRDPMRLEHFLDDLFSQSQMQISIKTRIGYEDMSEWENLMSIYQKYPMTELIIHPRLRCDFYNGTPHMETFSHAYEVTNASRNIPLCYNGDIVDNISYEHVQTAYPNVTSIMIGRGLLMYPGLVEQLLDLPQDNYRQRLLAFHDEIFEGYSQIFSGDKDVLMHMKQIWSYLQYSFEDCQKPCKKLLKSKHMSEYCLIVAEIFKNYPLVTPGLTQP